MFIEFEIELKEKWLDPFILICGTERFMNPNLDAHNWSSGKCPTYVGFTYL